jgi:hypothetical protein
VPIEPSGLFAQQKLSLNKIMAEVAIGEKRLREIRTGTRRFVNSIDLFVKRLSYLHEMAANLIGRA